MASSSPSKRPTLAQIAETILREQINVIIHDTIIHRHRDHKMMLMSLDPTTKLPLCDRCNLPILLDPPLAPKVRGATSDPPSNTQYCDKKPWCRKSGFDIYGNPFPKADITGRPPTKKEREAAKNSQKNGTDTPASNEGGEPNGTAPPSPSADGDGGGAATSKLEKGEKKASKIDEKLKKGEYIPWQTCPSCKRSLLITRFAKHLEQCMGLSGRQASRNAMAKMNGNGSGIGSGNGATPVGSRGGTPGPDSKDGDGEDDDDEKIKGPGAVRKKVLKKGVHSKLKKDGKGGMLNGKPAKPLPSSASSTFDSAKRDRDDDDADEEENVHVKKRQKLTRVESQMSIASASTAPPMSAVEMNRDESNDGSFVDDGGSEVGD